MNESSLFNYLSISTVCRVCLNSTNGLFPMSNEHRVLYENIVKEVALEEYDMISCAICRWMLQRFDKFKQQCELANNFLKEVDLKDSEFHYCLQKLASSHNFTNTKVEKYDYSAFSSNCSKEIDNDCPDLFEDKLKCESDFNNSNEEYTTNYIDHSNEEIRNDTHDNINDMIAYDTQDSDIQIGNDEDEIPLVLLRKNSEKNKKKSKKKKKIVEMLGHEAEVQVKRELESLRIDDVPAVKSKRMKELRDGFTSRMVQETDEYVVIKLTRDQVLQEMQDRAKSESYMRSPYRCEKCAKGFNFQDVLDAHMEKHSTKNGGLECNMCGQYCRSAVSLRGHIKSHTTRYKCKVCGHVRLSRQHLLEHYSRSHSGAPTAYTCRCCDFTTNKRTVMQRHVRRHMAGTGEPHACRQCGKLFKSIESLRLHTLRHDKSSRYKCERCDASFVYQSLLRKHVLCVHERREYYCVECDVQFKTAESLKLHFKKAKRHRDATAFKHACPECPSRFPSAAQLAVHLSAAHNAPKTHSCTHCRRLYSTRDALRAHAWRVHALKGARPTCSHCGTTFARKSSLKLHMATHTAARPYEGYCGAAFAQDSTLHSHVENKHKKDEMHQFVNKVEL